jgi:hypothetical protein
MALNKTVCKAYGHMVSFETDCCPKCDGPDSANKRILTKNMEVGRSQNLIFEKMNCNNE